MLIFRNMYYQARRFRMATLLNMTGLTVALMALYLLATQVIYNHEYNRTLTDYQQLYRLECLSIWDEHQWQAHICRPTAESAERLPQVESLGFVQAWVRNIYFKKGDESITAELIYCSDRYVSTLAPQCLSGTLEWTEEDQLGIIIPRSFAQAYFGEVDVAGRYVEQGNKKVEVRGVYEDFAPNNLAHNAIYFNFRDENKDEWRNFNYNCILRLHEKADTTHLAEKISQETMSVIKNDVMTKDNDEKWDDDYEHMYEFRLQPVTKTYFSGIDPNNDRGNRLMDLVLRFACLLIMVIATVNFLNFTLAAWSMRIRSVNTRRILGSRLSILRMQLVAETVMTMIMAWGIGVVLIYLLCQWPFIHEIIVGSIWPKDHLLLLLATLGASIVMGIAAGIYPSYYITNFKPAMALKGNFGLTPRGKMLRTALIALQFVVAGIMVVYIGILLLQSRYIFNSDYGYCKNEILYAKVGDLLSHKEALRTEALGLSGVEEVSYSQFAIGTSDTYMTWGRSDSEHQVTYVCLPCDWRYPRTLGVKITEGRDFSEHDQDTYIINQAMKSQNNWIEMDKPLLKNNGTVVGVCEDVRFASLRVDRSKTAMAFYIMGPEYDDWGDQLSTMNVRVKAGVDKLAVKKQLENILNQMNNDRDHEVRFLDSYLQKLYEEEFRFVRQILLFSIIALIVTLIGVFCLTMFETAYRRQEIGIRKILGATSQNVVSMLLRHYMILATGAFIVAAPLAAWMGSMWLTNFSERTPIYWWLFPLALLLTGGVTLLTVAIQAWRAATENPIRSIKTE